MENKTSVFSNSLIWFGAAVSIAEILTGTLIAPLGFGKGLAAILLGHFIGCILLFLAGLIGGQTGKSAMETVKLSFGEKGSFLFSALNVLQLVGWTAVMIVSGGLACDSVLSLGGGQDSAWIWCIVIGALIVVWLLIGIKKLGKLNVIAMAALFVLGIILSAVVFKGGAHPLISDGSLSFGAAVELSVAMPLSWLPLISDYTRHARKPFAATTASVTVYFVISSWMYLIGLGAAIFTGESDVISILFKSGLGVAAIIVAIFSTVTTTFLDAYSAGISSASISEKLKEKPAAIAVCVIGTALAVFTPITQFENFLYLIGSVFAPMIAIQIADYFILRKDNSDKSFNVRNLVIWLIGFVIYRLFLTLDTLIGSFCPVGNTLPVMLITGILALAVNKFYAGGFRLGGKKNVQGIS